jgi:hypothetical protein
MLIDCFSYKIYKTNLKFSYKKELIDVVKKLHCDEYMKKMNHKTTNAKIFDVFQNDSRFQVNNINLIDLLASEIENQLFLFSKKINLNRKLKISNFWCVSYKENEKCIPHIHQNNKNYSFSGIYYASFDKNEHQCTTFYNDESLNKSITPSCEEGDMLIYPTNIWHGYSGTHSQKSRIVFPFDICIKNNIKYY